MAIVFESSVNSYGRKIKEKGKVVAIVFESSVNSYGRKIARQ